MDMQKTIREIGIFETATNLAKVADSASVVEKVGAAMPLPDKGIEGQILQISEWLRKFRKKKYLFLTPEIALIKTLGTLTDGSEEAIVAIPGDMDPDVRDRIQNNVPRNIPVSLIEEIKCPEGFRPSNGLIVICGYSGNGRTMVLPETYRMYEHYTNANNGFFGKTVFVPYTELNAAVRYEGWIELNQQKLTDKWRT